HLAPATGRISDKRVEHLPELLRAGDLLVVNDAATLPGSLQGRTEQGAPIELRLLAREPEGTWTAVLFGAGDWRMRTEDRPAPPVLPVGSRLVPGSLTPRAARGPPPSRR